MPSVAISVAAEGPPFLYGPAAIFARRLAAAIRDNGLERWTLLNVNVPNKEQAEIRGVSVTHQGRRQYVERIDSRKDPWGRRYYWLCGSLVDDPADPGSDVHAVLEDRISVTPVHLDLTAGHLISTIQKWEL